MADAALRPQWEPANPWAGIPPGPRGAPGEPGIVATLFARRSIVSVAALAGNAGELVARLTRIAGAVPPERPGIVHGARASLIGTGVGQWLAVATDAALATELGAALAGLALVVEQSHSRAGRRLEGPGAAGALAKGCPVDLHPSVFGADGAAATAIAGMALHLWRPASGEGFEIAVGRSVVGSFWSWLEASAAAGGLAVAQG